MVLRAETNPKAAEWLSTSIEPHWGRSHDANYVAAVVPRGFEAYARVLHPAFDAVEQRPATWAEVADYFGATPHAQMQWDAIHREPKGRRYGKPFGVANGELSSSTQRTFIEPAVGILPEAQFRALCEILARFTTAPDDCVFAVWDGWGVPGLESRWQGASRLQLSDRTYYLLRGPIEAAACLSTSNGCIGASLWWPVDRAWCVSTEIDLMSTYIGGSAACVSTLLSDNRIEAYPTALDHRVDRSGDTVNTASRYPDR